MIGEIVCLYSFLNAVGTVALDVYSDKKDGVAGKMILEEDKFHFKDVKKFKLSFWLIAGSCVMSYMAIFPFLSVTTQMLTVKYCISGDQAPKLYGIPYIISAISSPFLGLLCDKVGRRVRFGIYILLDNNVLLISDLISLTSSNSSLNYNATPSCSRLSRHN